MKNQIVKNYLYNVIYQIFIVVVPLITTPYLARVLGAGGNGTFNYTQSIAQYFIMFGSLGSALYGQREVAYRKNDIDKRTVVFKEIIRFRIVSVLMATLLYLGLFCRSGDYKTVFLLLTVEVFASAFDVSWFFMGIQDFKKPVLRNLIIKCLGLILIFILVKDKQDVPLYTLCYSLPILISNLSLWFYLPKYLSRAKPLKFLTLKHFIPLLALLVPQIATEVYTVLDKTMLGIFASSMDEVGYYEQSVKIIKIIVHIITALGLVMLPRISELYGEGRSEEIRRSISNSFRFVFALGFPLMFGVIGIADNFVPWFFGDGYNKVSMLMTLISPIILLIGISNVIGKQYLLPTKKQKAYTISVVFGALVNFLLNLLLITRFNSAGAIISTLIAETSVTGIQIFMVRYELPIFLYFKYNVKYMGLGAVMCAVVWLTGNFLNANIFSTILQVGIGMIVYVAGLFVIRDYFCIKIIDNIWHKLRKRQRRLEI